MSQAVIVSKVAVCTSQPVAFSEHPSTRGHLTGPRNKPHKQASEKADQLTCGSGVVTISCLLIKLSIGDEKRSLPLCAYVAGSGKSGHIYEVIMTKERAQYINSVHTCSLCSIVLLQYVLLVLTGLKRKISV